MEVVSLVSLVISALSVGIMLRLRSEIRSLIPQKIVTLEVSSIIEPEPVAISEVEPVIEAAPAPPTTDNSPYQGWRNVKDDPLMAPLRQGIPSPVVPPGEGPQARPYGFVR